MKRHLSFALVFIMVFALAVPAMTSDGGVEIFKKANEWFVDTPTTGTLTVADNHKQYEYYIASTGVSKFGEQSEYSGQLTFVSFAPDEEEPYIVRITVVDARVSLTIAKVSGNTNPYSFTIVETIETLWSDGDIDTDYNTLEETVNLSNNYTGNVDILDYTVYVNSKGNVTVNACDIVDFEERIIYSVD